MLLLAKHLVDLTIKKSILPNLNYEFKNNQYSRHLNLDQKTKEIQGGKSGKAEKRRYY